LASLNDDRVGRCLDRLLDADIPTLTLAVVVHGVREFDVDLDELHNDSTTITFHGDYESADRERQLRGRLRLAPTWGHNKNHRPDLKHLLYILTWRVPILSDAPGSMKTLLRAMEAHRPCKL
jgi:hypothetical protein